MRRYDLISSLVFLVAGIAIAAGSLKLPVGSLSDPGPGLFPLITGILTALVAGAIFVVALLSASGPLGGDKGLWHAKPVITVAIMLCYAFALEWLGFLTVTLVALFVLFKAIGNLSFKASLGGAALAAGVAYLVFALWLKVQLPAGPLGL